jgi:hypothetical protein
MEHQKKSRHHEAFLRSGITDKKEYFDWYVMAMYEAAYHLVAAYVLCVGREVNPSRIHEMLRNVAELPQSAGRFDILLQLRENARVNAFQHSEGLETKADAAYRELKQEVNAVFVRRGIEVV